jgi:hypothetical protein
MPILLVPFATVGGKPKAMRTGSVIREPLPAKVLIIPVMNPVRIKSG